MIKTTALHYQKVTDKLSLMLKQQQREADELRRMNEIDREKMERKYQAMQRLQNLSKDKEKQQMIAAEEAKYLEWMKQQHDKQVLLDFELFQIEEVLRQREKGWKNYFKES